MSSSKKKESTTLSRQRIDQDIENFLTKGGKIQQISSGVSGQNYVPGPKSVALSKQPNKS